MPKHFLKTEKSSKHIYDLDLVELDDRISKIADKIPKGHQTRDLHEYYELVHGDIEKYCRMHGLEFSDQGALLVESDEGSYVLFLGLSLAFQKPIQISFILDHAAEHYKGNEVFINVVKFRILEFVERNSFFSEDRRIKAIKDWIKENRLITAKALTANSLLGEGQKVSLLWHGVDTNLKRLSSRLYVKKMTTSKLSFQKLFDKNTPTQMAWKGEPAFLFYLLHRLYNRDSKQIGASTGKAYLQATLNFCTFSSKKLTEDQAKSMVKNIVSKDLVKYRKIKSSVDSMLSELKI